MLAEYLKIVFRNLGLRRTRSILTTIGIFIGIAAIVALISITYGMRVMIEEEFERLGKDRIIVTAGGGRYILASLIAAVPLTEKDLEIVRDARGVEIATGILYKATQVNYKGEAKFAQVVGVVPQDLDVFKGAFEITKGRKLERDNEYAAIVGYELHVGSFFSKPVKLGDELEMFDKKFKVVGILERTGNKIDDSVVVVPLKVLRELSGIEDEITFIYVKTKSGYDPTKVAETIEEKLRKARNEKHGEESFYVQTSEQLLQRANLILALVELVLVGIASISLLVGGIGIMNTMYTNVLERTREIGIMKAVGARSSDVMLVFLLESGILGLLGGIVGVLLGTGVAIGIERLAIAQRITGFRAYLGLDLLLGALLFSFFVGVISGTLPARHAAKLNPVEALRYE